MSFDTASALIGQRIRIARLHAGIMRQSELAALLGVSQQTFSRWESNKQTPNSKHLRKVEQVLKLEPGSLDPVEDFTIRAAVSFDLAFPLESLTPTSFERFCTAALEHYYQGIARVHRVGDVGHTQGGFDILATENASGKTTGFQCKRVREFGPNKVRKAITAASTTFNQGVLLLSRVASPQARDEVNDYDGWELWDIEDISRLVRQLPRVHQVALVDTYFPRQRFALLGQYEAGPWQSIHDYFPPKNNGDRVFSQEWTHVGRLKELTELSEATSSAHGVVMVTGPGGLGKTRLVRAFVDAELAGDNSRGIHFVAQGSEVSPCDLETLGTQKKIIVLDDAHNRLRDRSTLRCLLAYASNNKNQTQLLITTRPYGTEAVFDTAINTGIMADSIKVVNVRGLNYEQTFELANQALTVFGGSFDKAHSIAQMTQDCPLFTVVAAYIVSKKPMVLFHRDDDFRKTILAKFSDVIKNEFIPQEDRNTAAKVLPVLALIQPFELTTQFYELIKGITHCEQQQVDRLLKALKSGGIVIGGSTQHRLAPDLLADFIIETNCISSDGRPTSFAKQLLEASSELYIEHILTNLGRFDWRRTQDDTDVTAYSILNSIWADLTYSKEDKSRYLKAIESVAFYQPKQALRFVQESIRRGLYLPKLPEILHDIAYQNKYLADVCKLLWLCVGNPSSEKAAIQVLTKLAALEVNKSVEINIEIAEFAIQLMDRQDAWENEFTPLEILSPMLETMTSVHRFRGNIITWTEHLINPSTLRALRERIVDCALLLIGDDDPRVATEAASLLAKALRYPMKERSLWSDWTPEFIQTMGKMKKRLNMSSFFPLVYDQLNDVLTWHTELNMDSEARMLAAQILSLIPNDLHTRVVLMLYRGSIIHLGHSVSYEERESARESELTAVCSQLLAEYPNAEDLRIYLSDLLSQIEKSKRNRAGSPHILFSRLIKESDELAEVTIERALQSPKHQTNQFSAYALATLLQHNYEYGMQYVHRILIGSDEVLHGAIGYAYSICWQNGAEIRTRDVLIVQRLLSSSDLSVLRNATYAISAIAYRDVHTALELMLSMSTDHMDLALEVLQYVKGMSVESLGPGNTMKLLERLRGTPRLRGYGIEEFIADASLQYPEDVMKFFMGRVEQIGDDFSEEPCDHAMLPTLRLQIREANNVHTLLEDFYAWMNTFSHDTPQYYWSIQLFVTLFSPIDDLVIGYLERWCQEASASQMLMLSGLLYEANGNFVFQNQAFVKLFLSCAMRHGQEVLENAVGSLTHSATSGVRSRTRGEPSSRDVANKEQAEAILESVNRHAPEYDVYRLIRDHGMEAIELARREKIELERSAEEGEDE